MCRSTAWGYWDTSLKCQLLCGTAWNIDYKQATKILIRQRGGERRTGEQAETISVRIQVSPCIQPSGSLDHKTRILCSALIVKSSSQQKYDEQSIVVEILQQVVQFRIQLLKKSSLLTRILEAHYIVVCGHAYCIIDCYDIDEHYCPTSID